MNRNWTINSHSGNGSWDGPRSKALKSIASPDKMNGFAQFRGVRPMPVQFDLVSPFQPAGDQPAAIEKIASGFLAGQNRQTLLGVTGSGKTFTAAHVIAKLGKPALILSHNKTLAAQLYKEFKAFFPHN